MKKRTREPWMPADEYGRSLPRFTVNLLVRDMDRSVAFYRDVLLAEDRHHDADIAALRMGALDFMLHADHTYDSHPWYAELMADVRRGLGAEMRLFGIDPDATALRAAAAGAPILNAVADKPHGWREVTVEDPDGYVWAVGVPIGG